jgi:hypothetical protein
MANIVPSGRRQEPQGNERESKQRKLLVESVVEMRQAPNIAVLKLTSQ